MLATPIATSMPEFLDAWEAYVIHVAMQLAAPNAVRCWHARTQGHA